MTCNDQNHDLSDNLYLRPQNLVDFTELANIRECVMNEWPWGMMCIKKIRWPRREKDVFTDLRKHLCLVQNRAQITITICFKWKWCKLYCIPSNITNHIIIAIKIITIEYFSTFIFDAEGLRSWHVMVDTNDSKYSWTTHLHFLPLYKT